MCHGMSPCSGFKDKYLGYLLSDPFPCRSTAYHFNPKPASPRFLSHSLVELLNQISPTFKKNFAVLQKKR